MTVAAVVIAAVRGGIEPNGVDVGTITAVLGWLVALVGAWIGIVQVRIAKKANVSGDAATAREQEHTARRDTIADRDALIAALERRDAAREAEHAAEVAELREEIKKRTGECDDLRDYARQQETVLLVHVPWDFEAVNVAAEAGKPLRQPPPLRPPPKEM